ncbi:MAG: tRNA lysidine(34) synthetase TilS [Acidobacteriia bacterium]|nr:tRNA lysidine(34) synthetase TilS [Terriglobia bacterium]
MTGLLQRITQTIDRHRMLARGRKVGVAVSGGADSVCLLHILLELAPRWDLQLTVLHLNHQLRGEESQQDAEFVGRLAVQLGLPFHLREADLARSPGNLEEAARHARLAFFQEAIESRAVDSVAVGHTRSDQAETVLFRFLRGSGTAGLAGVLPVTPGGVIRPLLDVGRTEVEEFLRERGIPWREDATNASPRFARNRIRHGLLPELASKWNPRIQETLAHTADWALAEEAYWEAEIDRIAAGRLQKRDGALLVRVDSLAVLPLAVARRLVRRAMEMVKGDARGVDFYHVAEILAMAASSKGNGRLQAPGLDILRSFEWLRFAPPSTSHVEWCHYRVPAAVPGTVRVPGTEIAVCLELIEISKTFEPSDYVYNNKVGCLDWRSLSGCLELRNWRPGDQYQPVGSTGKEKIKTLFQQARIPIWERRQWPILIDGASIVWARRFGAAAGFAAGAGTQVILQVREAGAS